MQWAAASATQASGSRAVADEVAEAPQLVRPVGLRRPDDRLERLLVAVDVGRDGDAHAGGYRLFGAQTAPPAGQHRRRAGGGRGRSLDHATARRHRARRRGAANVLQRGASSSGPRTSAAASCRSSARAWRSRSGCWSTSCGAPPRAPAAARSGARCWPARRRASRSRWPSRSITLPVSGDLARAAPRTSGWSPRTGSAGPATSPRASAIEAVFVGAGGALLVFAMRRFGRHWWAPARGGRGRLRRAHAPTRARSLIDPLFNTFKPLPPGELRSRRARARRRGGRRGRRGLRDGRLAPHDRRQRLRGRARLDQARRALRQPAERLLGGRGAARRRARARARPLPRRPARAALPGDRRAVRDARGRAAVRADRAAARHRRRDPRRGAVARAARPRHHDDLQPALARGRGARRPLLARAHRRARRADRLPAADRGPERLRPRPARAGSRSCSAPTRPRWSGSARRSRSARIRRRRRTPGGS